MTTEKKVIYGALFLSLILLAIMFYVMFQSNKKIGESANEREVRAMDKTIQVYEQLNHEKDLRIKDHEKNDSLLRLQFDQNKNNITKSQKRYENIPVIVNALSKDSLRRAIENY